jgi:hypothetical protein
MKFPQLPIGQSFTWQGEVYCKTSPIAATHISSGQTRMIPRSATPIPLGEAKALPADPAPERIERVRAEAALEALHRRCLDILTHSLPEAAAAEARAALAEALETEREFPPRP